MDLSRYDELESFAYIYQSFLNRVVATGQRLTDAELFALECMGYMMCSALGTAAVIELKRGRRGGVSCNIYTGPVQPSPSKLH